MEVKAVYKYARISAKKMRDVAQEIASTIPRLGPTCPP